MDEPSGSPDAALMARAVLENLRGDLPVEHACSRLGVDPAEFASWTEVFLAGGRDALLRATHNRAHLPQLRGRTLQVPHFPAPHVPAWLRATRGEPRASAVVAIVTAIVLQAVLPDRLAVRPVWLLPVLEGAALLGLIVVNPVRMTRSHPAGRAVGLGLVGTIVVANTFSGARLIHAILTGHGVKDPISLFGSGASIYVTNIVAFALLYWELDRGGPVARTHAEDPHPDFLFPQMAVPDLAHPDWAPKFPDYLYTSFTNATAFSPTDTMPLSWWAKALMTLQSVVALSVVGLVVARAVNILS